MAVTEFELSLKKALDLAPVSSFSVSSVWELAFDLKVLLSEFAYSSNSVSKSELESRLLTVSVLGLVMESALVRMSNWEQDLI